MSATIRWSKWQGLLVLAVGVALGWCGALWSQDAPKTKPMVFELRIYTTAPGRLPDLHRRFRQHTMKLFEKHGMRNVGYWVPVDKENTLIYIVAHESLDAAKRSWEAFRNDPVWKQVFKESRKNGAIVTRVERHFMQPTDYSPMQRVP